MNPLDWLLAALLLYSTIRAALNGFFREAFSLAGLVVGFPLACWYYREAAHALAGLITSPPVAELAGFALILAATTLLGTLLGRLFRSGARTVGLGFADRFGGALFGALRGAGIATALLLALTSFLPSAPWIRDSRCAPYLLRGAHAVSFTMPPHLSDRLRDGLLHLNHTNPDWIKYGHLSHTRITTLQP